MGADIEPPGDGLPVHAWLFGEDQGRYLVTTEDADALVAAAAAAGVPASIIGTTGGQTLTVAGAGTISLSEVKQVFEAWLPDYMEKS